MSNSGANRTRWSNLIKDKKADFIQQKYELPSAVNDEDSFRKHFEALCKANNFYFYTRLLPKLRYDSIIAFANAVDELVGHVPPDNLSGTISGGAFVAVKASNAQPYLTERQDSINEGTGPFRSRHTVAKNSRTTRSAQQQGPTIRLRNSSFSLRLRLAGTTT